MPAAEARHKWGPPFYAEAKANGYDTKALRAVIRIRKQGVAEFQEHKALIDLYLAALGMEAASADEP